jgi:hypothetical protein
MLEQFVIDRPSLLNSEKLVLAVRREWGIHMCLLVVALGVSAPALGGEQLPWRVNRPIVTVKNDLYRRHPKGRTAALVAVTAIGTPGALREVHALETQSDVGEDIKARWSTDNGRSWSEFVPVQRSNHVVYQGVTVWEGEASPPTFDPASGQLVQQWLRQIEIKGVYHCFTYVRTSRDLGRSWSTPAPLVYEPGDPFDPKDPLKATFLNRNEAYPGNNILRRADGTLVVCLAHVNAPGDAKNDQRPWRMGSILFFGKWNAGRGDYEWTPGPRVEISPEQSARGLMEPEVAELSDGRLLVVWRGSTHGWDGTRAKLPGRKFYSLSIDGGRSLAPPAEWKYDDGTSFYSPSSIHRMIRHSQTKKLYWLGNIAATPPQGNSPRFPLVIAEVDETKAALVKGTVTVIDDRQATQGPDVQFSNFSLYEDRETHAFVLHLTTYGQEADPADWATADNYRYVVTPVELAQSKAVAGDWKVGRARADITPKQPMWLAGYGGRVRPAEGTLHPIWIKALALEDARGYRVVLLSSDLCGLPKWMYDDICTELKRRHSLERAQIRLTNSHNHCAPAVRGELEDYYPLDDEQRRRVYAYSDWLKDTIVATIGESLAHLQPARLSAGEGLCTFAVNRRNNKEADVPALLARGERPKGPVDHSVPVLAVHGTDGKLLAVVFGYACHNTTLDFYQWCGDYAGFAQITLEQRHPGALALFVDGCGGDQNPLPRRTVALCAEYGGELADAVDATLRRPLRPLEPKTAAGFEFVTLDFERNPTREELQGYLKGTNAIRARWAKRLLTQMDQGQPFAKSHPYAVQAWRLGDQLWIALGGETLVDYAHRFKARFGHETWVTSYFADLTAYIPSRRNWLEGGYEVGYLYEYLLPADRWAPDLEERIAEAVERLVVRLGDSTD